MSLTRYSSASHYCIWIAIVEFLFRVANCLVMFVVDSVLSLLSSVIAMLLRARVNAALTIQLFSQLFHFINMSLFNRLVTNDSQLCTRVVGRLLSIRLRQVEEWAEKQGLELAAECHLARVVQVRVQ